MTESPRAFPVVDLPEDRSQLRMGVEQAAEFLAEEGFVDAGGKACGDGHAGMPGRQRGRGMARVEASAILLWIIDEIWKSGNLGA